MATPKKTNCTKNGNDYYRITKTIGGVRKEFYGKGKKEAERKLAEYIERYEKEKGEKERLEAAGYNVDEALENFGAGIEAWFFNVKKYECRKASTFDRYEIMLRKQLFECGICKTCTLCKSKIADVNRSMIKSCINKMEKDPSKTAGNIDSFITITKLYFEHLLDCEVISGNNPCRKLKPTRQIEIKSDSEDKYISKELREKIKAQLSSESKCTQLAVLLAFNSGLRQAELCALKWKRDVLWDVGIMVRETVSYPRLFDEETRQHHREIVLQAPKGNKERFVPLPEYIWPILKAYYDWQKKEFMSKGWGTPDRVLHSEEGGILIPKNLRRAFKRIQDRCGITDKKRFHDIRHSYITDLANENIPLSVVQSSAGHSDLKITERYIHTDKATSTQLLKGRIAF